MEFQREKRKRTTSATWTPNNSYYRQYEDSPRINTIVNTIFKKSFAITGNESYKLPKPESVFNKSPWIVEELQNIKKDLNETKSKLNNYCFDEWHQHTSQRNKAKDIEWRICKEFDPEFVTQAWCKFHEIVTKYPLVPKENIFSNNNIFISLHLCEAPGAFITCLNHYLKTNLPTIRWDWLAMTLNPYYEGNSNGTMISDDRFIIHTLRNWFFGKDSTGNLMSLENLDALIKRSKEKGKINLVTADGSISCTHNPGEQEKIVVSLNFCEVVAAIHILEAGGNFLLKIFTTFEHQSICLIYFLSCVFKNLHFYKPVTSKEGNSEVYLICIGFKGFDFVSPYLTVLRQEYGKNFTTAMFDKNDIPESFIMQIVNCAKFFKNHQCEVIENNIIAYNFQNLNNNYENKKISKLVADKYITSFPLQKLHKDLQIVANLRFKKTKNDHWLIHAPTESFNERQKKDVLRPVNRLLMYEDQLKTFKPFSNTFIFKPTGSHINICISIGKPYDRIQSSRFCFVQISEIYNLLFQTLDTEKKLCICLPIQENIVSYENRMKEYFNNKCKTIYFQYTQSYNNNEIMTYIKDILTDLQISDNLVLYGYLLLTQFSVGLIYLLSHTFECVEFITDDEIGCCIVFKCFKNRELILQNIEEVYKVVETSIADNKIVLSVTSAAELYDSDLYSIIFQLNNWIAKYCVNYIASIYYKFEEKKIQTD